MDPNSIYETKFSSMQVIVRWEVAIILIGFILAVGVISVWQSMLSVILGIAIIILALMTSLFFAFCRFASYLIHFFQYSENFSTPLMKTLAAVLGGSDRLGVR